MKRTWFYLLICVSIITPAVFTACATFNEESFSKGNYLWPPHVSWMDKSLPIEEHCYVVHIGEGKNNNRNGIAIKKINGKQAVDTALFDGYFIGRSITILPTGIYTFTIRNTSTTESGNQRRIEWQEMEVTIKLLPGHYYFLNVEYKEEDKIPFVFDDLKNYTEVMVKSKMVMPVEVIIEGIDSAIASRFPGFKGKTVPKRQSYTFNKS